MEAWSRWFRAWPLLLRSRFLEAWQEPLGFWASVLARVVNNSLWLLVFYLFFLRFPEVRGFRFGSCQDVCVSVCVRGAYRS
jgi:ABC-type uncharacterized transport system permease subunit